MPPSIEEVKQQIAAKYLGQSGIHGVGLRKAQHCIRVYLDSHSDETTRTQILDEIAILAAPFRIEPVIEEPPRLTGLKSRVTP